MADQYTPVANVGPGERDMSDDFGPSITGGALRPAVIPGYPTDVATGDQSYSPSTGTAGDITVPRAVFHSGSSGGYVVHGEMTADTVNAPPTADPDNDGLPDIPRYEPSGTLNTMMDADRYNVLPAPMLNPSAGDQGPQEQGQTDVNPRGPAPVIGNSVTAESLNQVYPDTTQDSYPRGGGASIGPRG